MVNSVDQTQVWTAPEQRLVWSSMMPTRKLTPAGGTATSQRPLSIHSTAGPSDSWFVVDGSCERERERTLFFFSLCLSRLLVFSVFFSFCVAGCFVIESGPCGVRPDEANEADRQTDNGVCKKCTRARQTGKKCRRQNPNTDTHNEATQRREPTGARNSKITSQRQWHRDNHHHHRRQRKSLHQWRQGRPAQPHQPHQ